MNGRQNHLRGKLVSVAVTRHHFDALRALCWPRGAEYLAQLDTPVEWHLSSGLGHGIDEEGLRQGGEFLARRFGVKR